MKEEAIEEYWDELSRIEREERFRMSVPQGLQPKASPFSQTASAPSVGQPAARPGAVLPGAATTPGLINLGLSLENVEQSGLLTLGQWPAYIESVEEVRARTGSQGIKFNLRFVDVPGIATKNPNAGRTGDHRVYITEKSLWRVKNTFCAVGQCDAVTTFDPNAARGVLVMVDVTEDEFTPEGQTTPRKTTKCDNLIAWPEDKGGPGTKFQAAS